MAENKTVQQTPVGDVTIEWNDSDMQSVYANIATATANREEFFLLFGTHQNWRGNRKEGGALEVNLSKRIVMNPHAAKRLAIILQQSLKAYEDQFGKIDT